jgi:hypothetical protein
MKAFIIKTRNISYQFSIVLKEKVWDVSVTVLTSVGEGCVARPCLSVYQRTILKKVFHKIKVPLLKKIKYRYYDV